MSPSLSKGSPVQLRHSSREAATVIDAGAMATIVAPARAWTRSHGSYGSPSSRTRYAYSAIGVRGSRCLALGRTGATTSRKPRAAALSRIAASIRPDSPVPCACGETTIEIALTVSGRVPARRSWNAHTSTWSQPRAGSSPRPAPAR